MRYLASWATKVVGLVGAESVRAWMSSLEYRVLYYDQANDPCFGTQQPRIYVFWHENILIPLYLRGHCDLAMLLSRHKDADVLARVAHHMGFDCVRGSTNRGSIAALRELTRRGRHMHLTITPDGPRGPRRRLAVGPIFLASKLGLPIVPLGFGADRPWRANSWDRFAVPRPFSRARAVVGPEIWIPSRLDRDQMEEQRCHVESLLTRLTVEAEVWATSSAHRVGEICLGRRSRVLGSEHSHLADPHVEPTLPLAQAHRVGLSRHDSRRQSA